MRTCLLACCVGFLALTLPASTVAQTCVDRPQGAIAWWSFDEASGSTVEDRVGQHPGSLTNGAVREAGQVGNAVVFDGADDYLAVADSDLWAFGAADFTIELWANFSAPGGGTVGHPGDIFLGNDEGPSTRNKWFFALGGGVLHFHLHGPSTGSVFLVRAPFSPVVNQWYHLAVTRAGDLYTIYLDGSPIGSESDARAVPNANAPLTIGQAEGIGFMSGRLDEVTIYDRALDEVELRAIANAGAAGKCGALEIRPVSGGNTGLVSVRLTGRRFIEDTTIRLSGGGQPDVESSLTFLEQGGELLHATFDLTGEPVGQRDVVIEEPNGVPIVLSGAFSIVTGNEESLSIDLTGLNVIRPNQPQNYWLHVENRGNTNSRTSYALVELPDSISYDTVVPPEIPVREPSSPADPRRFGFVVPPLAPGAVTAIPITLTASSLGAMEVKTGIHIPERARSPLPVLPGDIVQYPSYWTPSSPEPPPAGYLVLYDTWGGGASVAVSIGGGYVAHWRPRGPGSDIDGLTVHRYDLVQPKHIIRPPGWTPVRGDQIAQDFRPIPEGGKWEVRNDPDGLRGYWNGQPTTYDDVPVGSQSGLDRNCVGGAYFFFPELASLSPGSFFADAATLLYEGLFLYWRDNGDSGHAYDWRLPGQWFDRWIYWLDRSVYHGSLRAFKSILGIGSFDPNDKIGPDGKGVMRVVDGAEALRYSILFENLPSATAPAQEVVITDQLDVAKFDVSSVALGPIDFGSVFVTPPPGLSSFSTEVDLRPSTDVIVRIVAGMNPNTGVLTWRFTSLDPTTRAPVTDPTKGFLPPNLNPPDGQGGVILSVKPRRSLPTGSEIRNHATIVFDTNAPIVTPEWINTIDNKVAFKCQKAIGKAGSSYVKARLVALQKCRNAINNGTLAIVPDECAGESSVVDKVAQAGMKARRFVGRKCTNKSLDALSACSGKVDGLITPTGDDGCIIRDHAFAADSAIASEYGSVLTASQREERECQEAMAKAGTLYLSKRLDAIRVCLNKVNSGKLQKQTAECPTDAAVLRKVGAAARRTREMVARSCSDALIASIAPCALTLDELISASGDTGCLVVSHAAAVAAVLTAQYGNE